MRAGRVAGAGRPVSHQPGRAAGPVTMGTASPRRGTRRPRCGGSPAVGPRSRSGGETRLAIASSRCAANSVRPARGRVARVEVDVVDLQLTQPHARERGGPDRRPPGSPLDPGAPGVVGERRDGVVEDRRPGHQSVADLGRVGSGQVVDVGVARLVGVVHRRGSPSRPRRRRRCCAAPGDRLGVEGEVGDHVRARPAGEQGRGAVQSSPWKPSTVRTTRCEASPSRSRATCAVRGSGRAHGVHPTPRPPARTPVGRQQAGEVRASPSS